ncbi:unnamed protein product, partial [marine sediment metagenome]
LLGRISPEGFLGGEMQLFPERSNKAVDRLAQEFSLLREQMAEGILEVVNAKMANATLHSFTAVHLPSHIYTRLTNSAILFTV